MVCNGAGSRSAVPEVPDIISNRPVWVKRGSAIQLHDLARLCGVRSTGVCDWRLVASWNVVTSKLSAGVVETNCQSRSVVVVAIIRQVDLIRTVSVHRPNLCCWIATLTLAIAAKDNRQSEW